MKTKQLLLVLLASIMAITVSAQEQGRGKGHKSPEEKAKKQTELMKTNLQLSEKQAVQVEKINTKYALECDKLRQEMKEKEKTQRTLKDAELKGVLTPEQYSKLEQLREKKKVEKKEKKQQMRNCMKEIKANQPK